MEHQGFTLWFTGLSGAGKTTLARGLARGLHPVKDLPDGLMVALQELATRTRTIFHLRCRFNCRRPVLLSDIPAHREIAAGADFIPLIPLDDIGGFAREITRLRQMSVSERANVGEKCRKIVEERLKGH